MQTALFLKTYAGDSEWLPYCLRSIQKFCSGYTGVHVVSEDARQAAVVEPFGFTFHQCAHPDFPGYLHQQMEKMRADRYLPAGTTHVLFTDSDTLFSSPNTPGTWCINGNPRLLVQSYESLSGVPWKAPTERALRFKCPFETMRAQPLIFDVRTLRAVREHMTKVHRVNWIDYIRRVSKVWGGFSEFNVLGSFALKHQRDLYHVVDFTTGYYHVPHAMQYGHSWEGRHVSAARAKQLESILK